VGGSAPLLSEPIGRVSDASHEIDSLFCGWLQVSPAAGQEASSKPAAGQSARTAASPSIASPLTAKLIESLRATANDPGGDYFIASANSKRRLSSAFVEDNSKSDPTSLYLAANTAYRIGELKEAAFSFTAAQIRKAFDYKRYGLGKANGDNIQTYWGFLNQALVSPLNTAISRSPREFSEVVDMLGKWQVVPADDALYVKTMYGAYVLPKSNGKPPPVR